MCPTDSEIGYGTPASAPATPVATIKRVGWTRTEMREMVARVFGLHDDIATGGSTSTIVDSKLARFGNDYFNGTQAFIRLTATGSAPEGELVWVTDFDAATGTLTLSPSYSGNVVAGDRYQLYFRVSFEEINDALNKVTSGFEVATSLIPKDDSLDYYVTSAPLLLRRQQIIDVWRRAAGDVENPAVQVIGWTFEDAQGQLTLRMPYTMNSDDHLWMTYYAGEHSLEDCEYVNPPLDLTRAKAVVYLIENKINNVTDREWWGQQLRYWTERVKEHERGHQKVANKVRTYNWQAAARGGNALDNAIQSYHDTYIEP